MMERESTGPRKEMATVHRELSSKGGEGAVAVEGC
jgi:hypothetical protein